MATFIQMPTVQYSRMYQRPQHIMKELSEKGNLVYYMDNICENYCIRINTRLYEIGINYKLDYRKLIKPVILWCSSPDQVLRLKNMCFDYVVYDIIDDYSYEFEYLGKYSDNMLKLADIVFTSSESLYKKFYKLHRKVYIIRNGADTDNFLLDKNVVPRDLPVDRQIIGYTGAIAPWIDWNMISYITESKYNFVFIGARYGKFKINFKKNNVFFLGEKKYEQLPYYINNFNCCIIPFKVNKMTNACNPVKLYEYMCLGKPVVSTNIYEVRKLKNICYISKDKKEFMKNINLAVNEEDNALKKLRIKLAEGSSWNSRVSNIIRILESNGIL